MLIKFLIVLCKWLCCIVRVIIMRKEHIVCMLTIVATFSSSAFRTQLNLRMWRHDVEGQLYYLQYLITDDEPGYLILSAIKFFWREGISPTPFLSDSFFFFLHDSHGI